VTAAAVGLAAAFYVFSDILLPFVAGIAVAYLLDPVVGRMQRLGLGRSSGTLLVLVLFFVAGLGLLLLLVPILQAQLEALVAALPRLNERVRQGLDPIVSLLRSQMGEEDFKELPKMIGGQAGDALRWLGRALAGVLSGGAAIANILSLVFISPIVAYYLLRDWPELVARIDAWLPRANAETVRRVMADIDVTLSGFVRGQSLVCLALGIWYAIGLIAVGLDFAVLIGLFSGILSFVPFVGTLIGAALAVGLAVIQFDTWLGILLTLGVFVVGQVVEGNVLTPRLVGDRVGLHPVWVMFALLAGGSLFGFLGVLIAVPAAAALGVLARFGLERYLASGVYRGGR
jgi:predicted PurR-regulated permease PerM